MNRFDQPLLHLAEPTTRQRPQSRVHKMDAVFLVSVLAFVLGGALFVIDLAGARSSGQEITSASRLVSEAAVWTPAALTGVAKYAMLLLASVVNSALIVLLVTALRTLDRRIGRIGNRRMSKWAPMRKVQTFRHARAPRSTRVSRARETQTFLLSPVFR